MSSFTQYIEESVSTPFQVLGEMGRIFPDALIMGVGFFSLITLSFPYAIFFASLLESLLVFYGLRNLNELLNFVSTTVPAHSQTKQCRSGFSDTTMHTLSLFGSGLMSGFPSSALYMVTVAASYVLTSMTYFSAEIELMGQDLAIKWWTSLISSVLLVMSLILYRIAFDCDTYVNLAVSIFIGTVIGALLVLQNTKLFGLTSINILGLPVLKQRTADGNVLYMCPA